MLCNLIIDINANTVLVFSWIGVPNEAPRNVFQTLLIERPAPFPPVTVSNGPWDSTWQAARDAIITLRSSRFFKIVAAQDGYPDLLSLLEANYGKDFNDCWLAVLSNQDMPAGAIYSTILEYAEVDLT